MIPFKNTLPYELLMNDIYVQECPYCKRPNVLLQLKKKELAEIRSGTKKRLVFPCCYNIAVIVDTDADYLLANRPFPNRM